MKTIQPHRTLSRRDLLLLAAGGGIASAGGYALYEYSPWLDSDGQAEEIRKSPARASLASGRIHDLIRLATLAASGHNAQPWHFVVELDKIEIRPDYARRLPIVDPDNRELWISLGCALENLLIAARASGYAAEVIYPDKTDSIRLHLTPDVARKSPLMDAIPLRQNTRSEYDGKPIPTHDLDRIQGLTMEPGVSLRFLLDGAGLATVQDYVRQGNLSQFADKAFMKELIHWIRFDRREALASDDGLYSRCSGSPEVPRWIGEQFLSRMKPQAQAETDAKKLGSSSGAVVIASDLENKTAWVRTGQVYERMALLMTSLNIKSAFLNQPVEVGTLRGQFQSAIALGEARPQLLVRFGYAKDLPRSLRRPVEGVLMQA